MDQALPDFSAARNNMVDGQVRPNKVTDPRILDAMRTLPRERFIPPGLAAMAYIDEDVPLGRDRALMEPMIIARLVQLARGRPGERALVIAAGSGYGSALLDACGCAVTALEDDEALLAIAASVLPSVAPAIRLVQGTLTAGLPQEAPWDIIMIEGAVAAIPASLAGHLAPGGRLVTVLSDGSTGHAVLAELAGPSGSPQLKVREVFDCSTPMLPSFCPAPQFVF